MTGDEKRRPVVVWRQDGPGETYSSTLPRFVQTAPGSISKAGLRNLARRAGVPVLVLTLDVERGVVKVEKIKS